MEKESLIFTLFMVALLLTVSISDNITGRVISSSSKSQCVNVDGKNYYVCGGLDVTLGIVTPKLDAVVKKTISQESICVQVGSKKYIVCTDRIPAGVIDSVSDAKSYTIGKEKPGVAKALIYTPPDVSETEDVGCITHIDYCKDKNGEIFKNKCYPYNHANAIKITTFKCNSEGNCVKKSAYEDCKKIENPIKYGRCVFSDIGARCIYDQRAVTLWGAAAGEYGGDTSGGLAWY